MKKDIKIYRGMDLLDHLEQVDFKVDNVRGYALALGGTAIFVEVRGLDENLSEFHSILLNGNWLMVDSERFDVFIAGSAILLQRVAA